MTRDGAINFALSGDRSTISFRRRWIPKQSRRYRLGRNGYSVYGADDCRRNRRREDFTASGGDTTSTVGGGAGSVPGTAGRDV